MKPLRDLDQIKASDDLKKHTLQMVMQKKAKKLKPYLIGAIATGLVCLLCVILLPNFTKNKEAPIVATNDIYSYVSVDINPSMEFQLNKENQVVDIITYNNDAKNILSQTDFKGKKMQEVMNWLLENDDIKDYMVDGYMQVSVYSEDKSNSINLEKALDSVISSYYKPSQYGCSCASKSDQEAANEHHMSLGKYQAIDMITMLDNSYTLEELDAKSMRDLVTIFEELSGTTLQQTHGENHREGSGQGNGQEMRHGNHH